MRPLLEQGLNIVTTASIPPCATENERRGIGLRMMPFAVVVRTSNGFSPKGGGCG